MDNWKSATFHSGPFVGRTREISGLINTYQTVQRGQTKIVILKGVVGIGKSRLATEFLKKAQLLGAHILQARPFGVYACPPYQPIIEALSSYYPQPPHSSEIIAEQLYDSVAQAVQQLAEQRPVVLFIDNLTLADTATLDMLYAIGQRWLANNTSVLLLLAFRQEALVTSPTLAEWFTRIEQDLRASSVTLSHLKVEHVTQFIRQLVNKPADASDVSLETIGRWLFAETHGLPLYMVEVLDTLLDHNILSISTQADGKWGIDLAASALSASKVQSVLQPNMRSVIRARLTLLSAHASTLLATGAVLARPFSFEQVRLIADLEDHDGCAALDEILARHLLEEVGDGYFFTHDIIREIVYTEIPEAQQRGLHQSTLQVLEGEWSHDPSHAAELAYHAEAAGLWEQAFHRYVAAADYALQQRAVKNAIDLYEVAGKQFLTTRSLQATLTAIPASALQHHHLQLGLAYESVGKKEQAHSIYSNMVLQARRAGLVEYVYVGLNHLARLINDYKVDFAEAQELRRQMLQLINDVEEDGDIAVRAETEMHIAQLSLYRFDVISV
ncbi:MAG TPA: AAA family ATPase, partial [Ktedonobacteraceae bacterium]|nr:AAA family ATPase [Ktedonobacteraceae bacterium]